MAGNYRVPYAVDQTIGYLTLKERILIKRKNATVVYWRCRCVCGKETRTRQDGIRNGRVYSCGCKNPAHSHDMVNSASPQWGGCGELSGALFSGIKCRAKRLQIPWDLTLEYLWELFLKQKRRCALTGLPLQFPISAKRRHEKEQTASLDRIDSKIGYVPGNVQWVHKAVNIMKNHFPQETFIRLGNLIARTHPRDDDHVEIGKITATRNAKTAKRGRSLNTAEDHLN